MGRLARGRRVEKSIGVRGPKGRAKALAAGRHPAGIKAVRKASRRGKEWAKAKPCSKVSAVGGGWETQTWTKPRPLRTSTCPYALLESGAAVADTSLSGGLPGQLPGRTWVGPRLPTSGLPRRPPSDRPSSAPPMLASPQVSSPTKPPARPRPDGTADMRSEVSTRRVWTLHALSPRANTTAPRNLPQPPKAKIPLRVAARGGAMHGSAWAGDDDSGHPASGNCCHFLCIPNHELQMRSNWTDRMSRTRCSSWNGVSFPFAWNDCKPTSRSSGMVLEVATVNFWFRSEFIYDMKHFCLC